MSLAVLISPSGARRHPIAAHVQHDPESRKQLDAINAEIGTRASELQSFDDALATARGKLARRSRRRPARQSARRSSNSRSMNDEVRKLGPWLDDALADYVGGLRGLLKVTGLGLPHPTMVSRS